MDFDDLIIGEKFVELGDYVHYHYSHIRRGNPHTAKILYSDAVVVDEFLDLLPRNRPIVVITHNSDRNITDDLVDRLPSNVVKWYCQNVCSGSDRLQSLPIGLENMRWFPEMQKHRKIIEASNSDQKPSKLLYVNHAIWTNPGARQQPYELFEGKSWATTVRGQNGAGFDGYLDSVLEHFYTLSPIGNGHDAHRTWESLYCNRVPILIRSHNTRFYEDLPILLVDDWEEITEQLLIDKMGYFSIGNFNREKLKFSYWRDQVTKSS